MRRHHGRKRQRDYAGDENGASKRKREFAKQRAGQSALQSDRRIDRGQSDRHGDDGPNELARTKQCRVHARHAVAHVTFDVFDDDDRIIDDQPD